MSARRNPPGKQIKLALPKGKLLPATARLLADVGIKFDNYTAGTRIYRLKSENYPGLSAKMFHEKDVPVQVAVGNYDLGICGSDWIEELEVKYPASSMIKLIDFGYDRGALYFAVSKWQPYNSIQELLKKKQSLRIVTEYPNLAEAAALNLRLKKYQVFPSWGSVEVYPPEDADIAVLKAYDNNELRAQNLVALQPMLETSTFLIANRDSLQNKDVSSIIERFNKALKKSRNVWLGMTLPSSPVANTYTGSYSRNDVRLAVPDGHQRSPTVDLLKKAGIVIHGYTDGTLDRRPVIQGYDIKVKVSRPQDMPLHVANGNYDFAVTGKDWYLDHLYRFPSSPITKVLDLGFGWVRIVVVVTEEMPVESIADIRRLLQSGKMRSLRVASEYINIADRYLQENHMTPYRLIPTWGASEVFLPEDADVLIENTQTGKTLATHKLKIIDTIMESTACLVANKTSMRSSVKRAIMDSFISAISAGVEKK